jgi:hypothetical protein
MFDVNGTVTTDQLKSTKNVFTITIYKSLPQASTNYVNFQKVSTKSQLSYKLPRDTQLSSVPLKGSFAIKCFFRDGTFAVTQEIGVKNATWQIRDKINAACPNYKEKYDIWDGPAYSYYEDGRDLFLRFTGLNYDVPQMEVMSFDTNPVLGNSLTFNSTTHLPYNSKRIFYEPLPFEFLHTNETQP